MDIHLEKIKINVVELAYVKDLPMYIQQLLLDILAHHGIAILEMAPGDRQSALLNLFQLSEVFGKIIPHKPGELMTDVTSKAGFNDKSVIRPQSDNGSQTPHVDGVLMPNTPVFMAMYCINPGKNGGELIFLDMKKGLNQMLKLKPSIIRKLFRSDAVTVVRPNLQKVLPIFSYANEKILTHYSNHEYNHVIPHPEVKEDLEILSSYVKNRENQGVLRPNAGWLIIYVNQRVLHGRLEFHDIPGQERHFVRAWYDGNNSIIPETMKGIVLNEIDNNDLKTLLLL